MGSSPGWTRTRTGRLIYMSLGPSRIGSGVVCEEWRGVPRLRTKVGWRRSTAYTYKYEISIRFVLWHEQFFSVL